MDHMKPCVSCGAHVREGTCACPSCGQALCARGGSSAAALLLGLTLTGCGVFAQPEYGAAVMVLDADNDGFNEIDDCDDEDETIHPEAEELPGDSVDSNCDGEDDT